MYPPLNYISSSIPRAPEQNVGRCIRCGSNDIQREFIDVEKELMKNATKEDERTQRMRARLRKQTPPILKKD